MNETAANQRNGGDGGVNLRYIDRGLVLSAAEVNRLRDKHLDVSMRNKRLVLVLDLDHTLLNSARESDLSAHERQVCEQIIDAQRSACDGARRQDDDHEAVMKKEEEKHELHDGKQLPVETTKTKKKKCATLVEREAIGRGGVGGVAAASITDGEDGRFQHLESPLCHVPEAAMYTKLRPGARSMIQGLADKFEFYVYTMGERPYALAMCRLLDPGGRIIDPSRIIARSDRDGKGARNGDGGLGHGYKDLNVVMSHESAVVIVDDSAGIWPKHGDNLLVVDRYHFFRQSARAYNVGAYEAGINRGADGEDTAADASQMRATQALLTDIHRSFFDDKTIKHQAVPSILDAAGSCVSRQRASGAGDVRRAADVRRIIHKKRASVLRGVSILLAISRPEEKRVIADYVRKLGALHVDATTQAVDSLIVQPENVAGGGGGTAFVAVGNAEKGRDGNSPRMRQDAIIVAGRGIAKPNPLHVVDHGQVANIGRNSNSSDGPLAATANGAGARRSSSEGHANGDEDIVSALHRAQMAGVPIVTPRWIMQCFYTLAREDTTTFVAMENV